MSEERASPNAIAFPVRRPADDWTAEATYFTLDVFEHENEGRLEIDPFRYARYRVLGWIRPTVAPPFYELTTNGEDVYRKFYWAVAQRTGWDWYWRYCSDDEE